MATDPGKSNTGVNLDLISDSCITPYYFLDVGNERAGTFFRLEGGGMSMKYAKHKVTYNSGETIIWKIPTRPEYEEITLARGVGGSKFFYDWFEEVVQGKINKARRNCSIMLCVWVDKGDGSPAQFTPLIYWYLWNAYPVEISGFTCNEYTWANLAELTIKLCCEKIVREDIEIK